MFGKSLRTILGILLLAGALSAQEPFDLLIVGGRIVDGTGSPWYVADVGVRGGRIAAIGRLADQPARRVVNAKGMVVAPGFVDMMGGSTYPLLLDPVSAESKLRQGITTMLVGEGGSAAPQDDRTAAEADGSLKITWRTFEEYFGLLSEKGIALNVVHNVGAAQVRRIVLGEEAKQPNAEQMQKMKDLVAQAMRDGAVGLSTALIYPPGTYATTEEIIELARVAAQHGGVYFSHMRNESNGLLDAIRETLRIARESGIPAHIYHLKAAGQENWPLMEKAIALIQEARQQGMDVTADIYPYIRNGIGLGSFVHPRHYSAGVDTFLSKLSDAAFQAEVRREIENTSDWENWYRHVGKNWDNVLVSSVTKEIDPSYRGLSIQEIAAKRGVDPWTAFFDLIRQGQVFVSPKSMNEEQKHAALRVPFVSIDTDAAPINPATANTALAQSFHPRAMGAFPRVLAKYVREEKVISLEQAVHKMSALAANRLKLYDRGRLSPGLIADIIVFDPNKVQDTATFTSPLSHSVGIHYVFVKGTAVIDNGRWTGAMPGEVLRLKP